MNEFLSTKILISLEYCKNFWGSVLIGQGKGFEFWNKFYPCFLEIFEGLQLEKLKILTVKHLLHMVDRVQDDKVQHIYVCIQHLLQSLMVFHTPLHTNVEFHGPFRKLDLQLFHRNIGILWEPFYEQIDILESEVKRNKKYC